MLDTNPAQLWEEIERAEEYRRGRLTHRNRLVQEFHGPYWKATGEPADSAENHTYEFIVNMVPRLIFNNPRVNIRTRRSTKVHRATAEALSLGVDRWIADSSIRDTLRYLATDMLVGFGMALITFEDRPGMTTPEDVDVEEVGWPVVRRLSPDHVFFDPSATSFDQARFIGHKFRVDLEDLIEDARENEDGTWNLEEVRALVPAKDEAVGALRKEDDTPDRKEVWIYEIWLPEDEVDGDPEYNHGRLHTLAIGEEQNEGRRARAIREPRDYYGPEAGPYVMFGAYYVPDHPAPLAPLVATAPQAEDLNMIARAVSRGAKTHKQIILAKDPNIADIVENGADRHVFQVGTSIDNDSLREVGFGGITTQQIDALNMSRDRIQRISGLSDAMRGEAGGDNTATAEQIAFQSANTRVDFLRQAFETSTVDVLTRIAWFLFNDDTVAFPLMVDGATGDEGELWFQGGPTADIDMSFGDLELLIEPYSMERTNDSVRMRRLMDGANLAMNMGQMMPTMPHVNWKQVSKDVGDAWNIPDFDARFNWDVLEQLWQASGIEAFVAGAQPAAVPAKQVGRDGPADTQVRPAGRMSGAQAPKQEKQ